MSAKAKNLLKGSVLRTFYFFTSVLVGLFLMPFMIRYLGDEIYGLWMFIASMLGFYFLFDMGLNSAIQRYVSQAIGKEDYREANVIVNTSFVLFIIIGIFVLFFSFILACVLPLILKNITDVHLFWTVMIILGANLAVRLPMNVFSGILTANLRYDVQMGVDLFKLLMNATFIVLFLKLGYGVIAVALVFCFSDLIGHLLFYLLVKKLAPYIIINKRFFVKSRIRELFSYSWKTLGVQVADKLRFNIDNFVIVGFLGLNFVTVYAIAARLGRHFISLITSAIGILIPVFSQYEGDGDFHSIREKFILTTKISSYSAIFIGESIIIFGKAFIERWMGPQYLEAYPLLVVLIIPITIALMQNPSIQLLYGISKHHFYTVSNSIEGVANLVLSLILVQKFGLMGVVLGTAVPMIIIKLLIQPNYICKVIGLDIRMYYSILLIAICQSTIIIVTYAYICRNFITPSYLNLILMVLSELSIFLIVVYFIGFTNKERQYFKALFRI